VAVLKEVRRRIGHEIRGEDLRKDGLQRNENWCTAETIGFSTMIVHELENAPEKL
jgi:hypothetical protein